MHVSQHPGSSSSTKPSPSLSSPSSQHLKFIPSPSWQSESHPSVAQSQSLSISSLQLFSGDGSYHWHVVALHLIPVHPGWQSEPSHASGPFMIPSPQ